MLGIVYLEERVPKIHASAAMELHYPVHRATSTTGRGACRAMLVTDWIHALDNAFRMCVNVVEVWQCQVPHARQTVQTNVSDAMEGTT